MNNIDGLHIELFAMENGEVTCKGNFFYEPTKQVLFRKSDGDGFILAEQSEMEGYTQRIGPVEFTEEQKAFLASL